MKTIKVTTEIPESREVRFTLPADVPTGPVEIVLVIGSVEPPAIGSDRIRTFGDLLASGFVGSGRDRTDIGDTADYAARLRDETWSSGADRSEFRIPTT